MAKLTLPTIASGYATVTQLNAALDAIEAEFQNKVLYRDNPIGEPNSMSSNMDMNSFDLLNVRNINGADASNLADLSSFVTQAEDSATASALSAAASASSATDSLTYSLNSETSAISADNSAIQAGVYSSMGLGGASFFDFGLVSDTLVIFPTDWGTI